MTSKQTAKLFETTESFGVELNEKQKKLVKSVQALLIHAITAEDEAEYFEAANTLIKKTIETIQAANYPKTSNQPHLAVQAVEYAIDFAQAIDGNDTEYDN